MYSPYRFRCVVLWMLLLIGMILHFNYHVSGIFYGVELKRPGADGTIPASAQMTKSIFYHLPMLFIAALLFFEQRWFRISMFVISLAYTVSHAFHLAGEFKAEKADLAQIPLLSVVLILSILLSVSSYHYFKYER